MFLAKSIAQRSRDLGIQELVFMDNNEEKLRVFGGMAKHVAGVLAPEMQFCLTTDAIEAVKDADYVITTIRVGGDEARAHEEHIALDLGLLGQETTGAAGFSFAMRSVPALLSYCELVKRWSKPEAKVFNFTNPVGIVSQALRDAGYGFTYGVCDAPSGMLHQFADLYHQPPESVRGEMFGLNHLSWFHRITMNGQDIMPQLLTLDQAYEKTDMRFFDPDLIRDVGCVPNEYLYYYYYREQAIANILKAGRTRGDDIMEINTAMLAEMRSLDPSKEFDRCLEVFTKWYGLRESRYMAGETGRKRHNQWRFDMLSPDPGGYAGVALRYMEICQSHQKGTMILCTTCDDAVDFLQGSDTVEVTCEVEDGIVTPHRFLQIPEAQKELIRRVKYYERVGAQAILQKDRSKAVECLMLHPLVNSWSLAKELVNALLRHNEPYMGRWEA